MFTLLRNGLMILALSLTFLPVGTHAAWLMAPRSLALEDGGTTTDDTTPTLTWVAADGATWYDIKMDSGSYLGIGNVFSYTLDTLSEGSHTAYLRAHNNAGTTSSATTLTFEIDTNASDGFTVGRISPSTATEDEEVTLSVSISGDEVVWCDLYIDDEYIDEMDEEDSNSFVIDYTFTNDGSYDVYALCGNDDDEDEGTARTITVSAEEDTFSIPAVTPSTATEDESTTITARPSDDAEWCRLYVSGSNVGEMTEQSNGTFTKKYTFTREGSYKVYVTCESEDGDTVRGTSRYITVRSEDDVDDEDLEGELIKIACSAGNTVSDPCRAVYYYGTDGYRHAFPNESVYYDWYDDFDDVIEISSSRMASLSIGRNITYHPGSVLISFQTIDGVFAITKEHVLHEYDTNSLIRSDWGEDWEDDLVEVPVSLYTNYTIGSDIDSSSDYDRDDAYDSVDSISDLF